MNMYSELCCNKYLKTTTIVTSLHFDELTSVDLISNYSGSARGAVTCDRLSSARTNTSILFQSDIIADAPPDLQPVTLFE